MTRLSHEESVELMLLFICSQIAAKLILDPNIGPSNKDEIIDQMERISACINLQNVSQKLGVH